MVKQFSNVFIEHILQAKYDLESQHNTMDINGASVTFSPCSPWMSLKNSAETLGYPETSKKLSVIKY